MLLCGFASCALAEEVYRSEGPALLGSCAQRRRIVCRPLSRSRVGGKVQGLETMHLADTNGLAVGYWGALLTTEHCQVSAAATLWRLG